MLGGDNSKKGKDKDNKDKDSMIDKIMLDGKSKVSFDDFAEMFEHSFSNTSNKRGGGGGRVGINPIAEFSLNEEQLNNLKEDELKEHLQAVREEQE